MFYIKDDKGNPVELTGEMFTKCGYCEKEMEIDISDFMDWEDVDICSTTMFCTPQCAEKDKQIRAIRGY
jgi:hypothetical protein